MRHDEGEEDVAGVELEEEDGDGAWCEFVNVQIDMELTAIWHTRSLGAFGP